MNKNIANTDIIHMSVEEKEKKILEDRNILELNVQRKYKINCMINKRKMNLLYLKKIHEGNSIWLNTVLFTNSDLTNYINTMVSKQRIESYFTLGISISKILKLNTGISIIRGFSQLLEEWEYMHSGNAMQSMKFVMAKNSNCIYPQLNPIEGYQDLLRPSIYKFNNIVVYEYLEEPHIPFELDYVEVLYGLCDMLILLYEELVFIEDCYENQLIYDTIVRLDTKIKHHIINLISKEITQLCISKVKAANSTLQNLTKSNPALYTHN